MFEERETRHVGRSVGQRRLARAGDPLPEPSPRARGCAHHAGLRDPGEWQELHRAPHAVLGLLGEFFSAAMRFPMACRLRRSLSG